MAIKTTKGQRDLIDFAEVQHQDIEAALREALADLVRAVDALHAHDDVVRELTRAHVNVQLCIAQAAACRLLAD